MRLNVEDLKNGKLDGQKVWVCHYNQPDLDKKPLRNLPPTEVLICPNSDLPENKRIYYSESHMRPVGKNGQTTSKILSPVDNTGWRSNPGNPVYVFDNEAECIQEWNAQLNAHMKRVDVQIQTATQYWVAEKTKLTNLLK